MIVEALRFELNRDDIKSVKIETVIGKAGRVNPESAKNAK